VALMTGLFIGGLFALLCLRRAAERPEFWFYDLLAHHAATARTDEPVALVAIDDTSVEQVRRDEGLGWPWPRRLIGVGLKELSELGAKVVVLDQLYADPSPSGLLDEVQFVESVRTAGHVVVLAQVSEKDLLGSLARGRWAVQVGHPLDRDELLATAAEISARNYKPFAVTAEGADGGATELWAGGLIDKATATAAARSLADLLRLPARPQPAVRELSAAEMSDPVDSEDWVTTRDALQIKGAEQLAVPSYDAWVLPRTEVVAAASRVGIANDTIRHPRESLEATSDYDEVKDDDRDLPRDDLTRQVRLFTRKGDKLYPTAALAALRVLAPDVPLSVEDGRFRYGTRAVPVNRRGFVYVTYPKATAFSTPDYNGAPIPFAALLQSASRRERHLPLEERLRKAVAGKVVVVGHLASDSLDVRPTPIAQLQFGAAVVASTVRTLLDGQAVARASPETDALWALALGLIGALYAFGMFRSTRSTLFNLLVGGGGLVLAAWLFQNDVLERFEARREWHAVFWPALGFVISVLVTIYVNYGDETNDRMRVIEALGRLTPSAIIDRILTNPHLLRPERRNLTLYFSDLVGFGRATEAMKAPVLAELMASYFAVMNREVHSHKGHVDKYMGDGLMAFWNAPLPVDQHALWACKAALAMQEKVDTMRADFDKRFGVRLYLRAGLNTGEAVVGELGAVGNRSGERPNYTAVGDAVKTAAMLEAANAVYGTHLLAGEATQLLTAQAMAWRELDLLRVDGVAVPVRVFELQGKKGELGLAQVACDVQYAQGLAAYRSHKFGEARAFFKSALVELPTDGPSAELERRCALLAKAPPPPDWDGAWPVEDQPGPVIPGEEDRHRARAAAIAAKADVK
jgi:adenylate cyclase